MKKLSAISALCLLSLLTLPASLFANDGIAPNIDRSTNANVDTVIYKTGVQGIATIEASFPAGSRYNPTTNINTPPANPAIAMLTAAMLDQGTTTHDKYAIAAQLEAVGATISFDSDNTNVSISAKCLTKDIPLVIALMAEQLRTPAFNAEEFAKTKTQLTGSLQRALENTDARASRAFAQGIYDERHPNYRPSIEDLIKAISATTLDDLKKFHAANYGPAQFTLVAVGDVEAATLKAAVAKAFSGWTGGNTLKPQVLPPAPDNPDASHAIAVNMPDKTSVSIVWGQPTHLKYGDPDYYALTTATAILGSGFTGRLLANVRDKEGLTYGIGTRISNDTFNDGDWRIVATFAPALLDKGIASTRHQLEEWYNKGVTADELTNRKSNIIGAYKVSLATTEGMANAILATIQRGQPLSALDDYPSKIEALTLADVNAAIKKHLNPADMVLVKAGTIPETK